MADVNIRVTRVLIPTTTGNQDITISGFGTPKAAMFIMPNTINDGTPNNNAIFTLGTTDGTRQWTCGMTSRNGTTSGLTARRGMTDKCICALNLNGTVLGEAGFNSWITDGVRINWNVASTFAYYMTVILFNGADLTARSDTINLGTSTGGQSYSSLSAEADVVITGGINSSFGDVGTTDAHLCLGFVHNNRSGTITQRCTGIAEASAQADGAPFAQMMEDKCLFGMAPSTGSIDYEVSLSSFTSSGFTYTCSANTGSDAMGILALSLGGGGAAVGTYSPPTSATSHSLSTPTLASPEFCFLGLNTIVNVDTLESDSDAGTFGISSMDSTAQYCHSLAIEDLAATTNTQNVSNDQAIDLPADTGATLYTGTLSSLSSTGVNLSYSNVSATTRKWIYLVIGDKARRAIVINRRNTIRAMLRR